MFFSRTAGWFEYVGEYMQWFYAMLPSWSAFSQILRYGPAEEAFELTAEMQDRVDRFKLEIGTAWDENEPEHLELLERFWQLCFGGETPFERRTKRWTDVGFQGPDPGTDFRGAGVQGLRHLVYFAQNRADDFKSANQSGYPLAIAGLNVTMMIYSCLGWGFKKVEISNGSKRTLYQYLFSQDDRGDRFEMLYCRVMQLLDAEWKRQNATYMMFPVVIQAVREQFLCRTLEFCIDPEQNGDLIKF